ncbi:WD repeat domain phosphoinositide-interacting protein 2-like [Dendronephthya gigantea]|uniref:WD repeat domain phosphoinositide-interacting protein 2-like n=1 Tax=Dendronephthya gigantea TaxID=151771 RepID=UPI00106A2191|nr:WD repeat domain phosphoinositide-interacting protein 2-like [Dendronephthya gigantea]
MNLASSSSELGGSLLFVNFNQDVSSIAIGSKTGYKLFSLNSVEKLEEIYAYESEDICIVERLFSSSLVAVVSLSAPRKLKVCHFKKGTEICNYSYPNTILSVKLNRMRLLVTLEESLYIHNIRDMKVLHTIRDTPPNTLGLCALSPNSDNCYLAYPGSNQIGEVQIFDAVNLRAVTMISAHDSPMAALTFNASGTKLASASEKGTIIRVFSIPDGQKLFEFRRGVKRCVVISSLAFSMDSMFLSASSNTETVHVFKLEMPKDKPVEEPSGWMGYFGKALSPSSYLPSQVAEVFSQGRAFANVKLPMAGLKNVCGISTISRLPRLLVATADGYLYIYNIDPEEGGDCTLLKQHRILEATEAQSQTETKTECEVTETEQPKKDEEHAPRGLLGTQSSTPPTQDNQSTETNQSQVPQNTTWYTDEPMNTKLDDEAEFPPLTLPSDTSA